MTALMRFLGRFGIVTVRAAQAPPVSRAVATEVGR